MFFILYKYYQIAQCLSQVFYRFLNTIVFYISSCSFGSIAITLRNRGTDAYKASEYGESIVVERRISRDGQSVYKIKNGKC